MGRVNLRDARSLLFTPGDDARKIDKALASGADLVVLDLEDAVLPGSKDSARVVVESALRERPPRAVAVRVNSGSEADLHMVAAARPDAVVVPKSTPAVVERSTLLADGLPVLALVETAAGLVAVQDLARQPQVAGLALGNLDLSVDIGFERRADGQELLLARSQVALASAAAAIRPPFDGVYPDYRDLDGFRREAELARSLGFGGKLCIHPAQADVANDVFAPRPEDVAWAERVLAEFESAGGGIVAVDGAMVDEPVLERARRLLARARAFASTERRE